MSAWDGREEEFARLFVSLPNAVVAEKMRMSLSSVKGKALRMGLHKAYVTRPRAEENRPAKRIEKVEDKQERRIFEWHDDRRGYGRVLVHRMWS